VFLADIGKKTLALSDQKKTWGKKRRGKRLTFGVIGWARVGRELKPREKGPEPCGRSTNETRKAVWWPRKKPD